MSSVYIQIQKSEPRKDLLARIVRRLLRGTEEKGKETDFFFRIIASIDVVFLSARIRSSWRNNLVLVQVSCGVGEALLLLLFDIRRQKKEDLHESAARNHKFICH